MRSRKDPFRGRRFTAEFMLWAQRGYLQFPVNYRNRERMLVDRSVAVDHTTVYRWIQADALEFDKRLSPYLRPQ
jgi:transposase, IS6 family